MKHPLCTVNGDEKGKIVGSEGCKHKGSQKPRIQFYNGLGYIQLPFIHLVSKNNNKK